MKHEFSLRRASHRAFTLVEMLIALAILSVLLAVAFLPINIATNLTSLGTARAGAQSAGADALRIIRGDVQKALVILPNDSFVGVTDKGNYLLNKRNTADTIGFPYLRTPNGNNGCNALSTANGATGNTARLDLILPADSTGTQISGDSSGIGVAKARYIVSYYARRRKLVTKDVNGNDVEAPYHPIDNPIVLFRAQMPISNNTNLLIAVNERFAPTCSNALNQWLTQNQANEFNLEPFTATVSAGGETIFGQHSAVLARDTALIAPRARVNQPMSASTNFMPDLSFLLSDEDGDERIETVKVQISTGQYDREFVNRRSNPNPTAAPVESLQPQVARTLTETMVSANVKPLNVN